MANDSTRTDETRSGLWAASLGGSAGTSSAPSAGALEHEALEHPLAMVGQASVTENRELIELDVGRLHREGVEREDEERISQVLVRWTRARALDYRQGMHEICAVLYAESGGDVDTSAQWLDSVMEWLYPLFYEDEGVNVWAGEVFAPMLARAGPKVSGTMQRYAVDHTLWCMRWCRLLLLRELQHAEVLRVWDELFATQRGKGEYVSAVVVLMVLGIGPELMVAQSESEVLQLLLHYPGLRMDVEQMLALVPLVLDGLPGGDGPRSVEDEVLAVANPAWYKDNRDIDIGRLRMEARLRRRVEWRLKK